MNNKIYISIMSIMFLGLTLVSAPTTEAFGYSSDMIKTLSKELGVDENKVQKALDVVRGQRHQEMSKRIESKLSQQVKNGKLTESQKKLILDKHKEIQKEHFSETSELKDLTPEQRREHMQKERDELRAWAKENNIDLSQVFGLRHINGMHMGGMMLKK